jgi:arginine-tRNA-protein transferase
MRFRVLWDQHERCPYLPDRTARLPLRVPLDPVAPSDFDALLAAGERRSGRMMYRTQCPSCAACVPLRVPVADHAPTQSQRRVWRRNEGDVRVAVGPPVVDEVRLNLYNRHKIERGLSTDDQPITALGYRTWLVDSCADSREVRYYVGDRLVAVSVLDVGLEAASSVYHYFDPDESRRSLGVFSVLAEIEVCRQWGLRWYYLGFWVEQCRSLAYKANYWPHERREGGAWRRFSGPEE